MNRTVIESAIRILIHARNTRTTLRSAIRALIRKDCQLLRSHRHEPA